MFLENWISIIVSLQDLLESQMINTMHNEFRSLKEKIIKLEVTVSVQQMELTKQSMEIRKLQAENYFLRHHVPPETLVQLFNQQIPFTEDNLDFNIQLQRNNFE